MELKRVEVGERRRRSRDVAEKLMAERQQVFILFNRVAGVEPYSEEKPNQESLQAFCQLIVDYIAAGHFALYQRISEGKERRQRLAQLAEQIYPRIAETTQAVLDFNDKYEQAGESDDAAELSADLSKLGEHLAVRAELEDRLIAKMLAES
ncbi:MAG: sigma D regulator [Gammaproteobacteria bacterium]|nr:sigma D regulator [Gammaproteobacteria bacterium]NIR84956.1 sigma D regulator [Gammaproteobacteria bacterium]NIR91805.1 sigma D regulator [Gammaproteobacteria bacterium]NIU06003.1 sigma D regulator [Gammaproteobacteria bacterium]NIV53050.1 Rsd/AlgQ family anti-sigma factor [Gammaproteobacteria bacterium]